MQTATKSLLVLSGQHLGAQVALESEQSLQIGCSEVCDIIFSDHGIKAHHCVIHIVDGMVSVEAIDGEVLINHQPVALPTLIELGEVIQLGVVLLVIIDESTDIQSLVSHRTLLPSQTETTNGELTSLAEPQTNETLTSIEMQDAQESTLKPNNRSENNSSALGVLTVLAMFGLFGIGYNVYTSMMESKQLSSIEKVESPPLLSEYLGITYPHLTMQSIALGGTKIVGVVENARVKKRVIEDLRGRYPQPYQWSLRTVEEFEREVKEMVKHYGVQLAILREDEHLVAQGYLNDELLQAKITADIDKITDYPVKWRLVSPMHLEQYVSRFIEESSFNDRVDVQYGTKDLSVSHTLGEEDLDRLKLQFERVASELTIPLLVHYQHRQTNQFVTAQTLQIAPTTTKQEPLIPKFDRNSIRQISTQGIPYIVTNTGDHLFIGAEIEQGITLQKIEFDRLTLSNGDQLFTINLN